LVLNFFEGLSQALHHIRRDGLTWQLARNLDRQSVRFQISQARWTAAEVLFDPLVMFRRQTAGHVVDEEFDELAAGNHHATSSK
jgi:hypothetical protein